MNVEGTSVGGATGKELEEQLRVASWKQKRESRFGAFQERIRRESGAGAWSGRRYVIRAQVLSTTSPLCGQVTRTKRIIRLSSSLQCWCHVLAARTRMTAPYHSHFLSRSHNSLTLLSALSIYTCVTRSWGIGAWYLS
jgi:hypothetical protein